MTTRIAAVMAGVLVISGAPIAASELAPADASMRRIEKPLGQKEVRVDLSSASLGDCVAAPLPNKPAEKSEQKAAAPTSEAASTLEGESIARDCTNSVQISIGAGAKASASKIRVKSVELFDEGKIVAKLTASAPVSWSESTSQYEKWNEKVAAGKTMSASYTLSQPDWSKIPGYKSKTFRIKVVLSVAGTEHSLERNVSLEGEIELPPDVVT